MEYPFWVNDFNRISNYQDTYPLEIKIPNLFGMEIIQRNQKTWKIYKDLNQNQLPILVMYNIPNRDVGNIQKVEKKQEKDI